MRKKKIILVILIGVIVSGIVLLYSSYALFSQNQISKSVITIKVGTINGTINIDDIDTDQLVIPASSSKTFTVTLENNNNVTGNFLLFYFGSLNSNIKIGYTTSLDTPPNLNGVILSKGENRKYLIKVENKNTTSQTIKLGVLGGLENQPLTLPSDGILFELYQETPTDESCFTFNKDNGTITDYSTSCPKDVVIPSTIGGVKVVTLGMNAFHNKYLTSVVIPNTVTAIGWNTFYKNKLTTLEIPNSVETIATSAFQDNKLKNVTMSNNLTSIGGFAFAENQLTSLIIPDSVTSIGNGFCNGNLFPDDSAFFYKMNANKSIDYTTLISYCGAKRDNVTLPSNVVNIGAQAFANSHINSVTISSRVTTIGYYAFAVNNLTTITIPSSVTSIDVGAINKVSTSNPNLVKIVNKTGNSFDWKSITNGSSSATFVTGTIKHSSGNITVTS